MVAYLHVYQHAKPFLNLKFSHAMACKTKPAQKEERGSAKNSEHRQST